MVRDQDGRFLGVNLGAVVEHDLRTGRQHHGLAHDAAVDIARLDAEHTPRQERNHQSDEHDGNHKHEQTGHKHAHQ